MSEIVRTRGRAPYPSDMSSARNLADPETQNIIDQMQAWIRALRAEVDALKARAMQVVAEEARADEDIDNYPPDLTKKEAIECIYIGRFDEFPAIPTKEKPAILWYNPDGQFWGTRKDDCTRWYPMGMRFTDYTGVVGT